MRRPQIDSLETRRCFDAFDPTALVTGTGTLYLGGTSNADTVDVKLSKNGKRVLASISNSSPFGDRVRTVNVSVNSVRRIRIEGFAGKDRITLVKMYAFTRSASIYGGDGMDTINVQTSGDAYVETGAANRAGEGAVVYLQSLPRLDLRTSITPATAVSRWQDDYDYLPGATVVGSDGQDVFWVTPNAIVTGGKGIDQLYVEARVKTKGQYTLAQLVTYARAVQAIVNPAADIENANCLPDKV